MEKFTSKDVARLAGVSQTTVSFVLNQTPGISLSPETRQRVLNAVEELHYVPNSFAKGLKTNKSKLLSVVIPSMDNPFYPMLMKYIERYTASIGYNLILGCTYRNAEREKAYLDLCVEKQVDGIIYLFTPNWLKYAVKISRSIPMILIGEKSDEVPLNTISLNGFQCGYILTKHLLELGHRRFVYAMSPVTSVSQTRNARLEGICNALKEADLGDDALQVIIASVKESDSLEADAGYSIMDQLLQEGNVTAFIGVNDMVAFGALSRILNDPLRKAPRDISICGFDNIYLSSIVHPTITTVDYCTESLCKLAVDMLLNDKGDTEILKLAGEPRLILRESTGVAPIRPGS